MTKYNLHNKTFVTQKNQHGVSSGDTVFQYTQISGVISASYAGGPIFEGMILGKPTGPHTLELLYQCITTEGVLRAGAATGRVSTNESGLLVIQLDWRWLNGDLSSGKSEYVEVLA